MTFDWNTIVQKHGRAVFGVAWRILGHAADAEDIVQEVFLEAHQLKKPWTVRNWGPFLKRIAACRAVDRLRSRRTAASLDVNVAAVGRPGPEECAVDEELQETLRRAVALLPAQQAAIFCLRYFEDLTNDEIASSLGVSGTAVSTALNKARKRLRELLSPAAEGRV